MAGNDEALLTGVVSSVVQQAGLDCEDLTVRAASGRRLVRVVVDRDGGVGSDELERTSRALSAALDDQADALFRGRPYTLEVTSRGVRRPLTEPRHFRRAAGRMVTLALADGQTQRGRILRADAERLVLLTGRDGLQEQSVRLAEVEHGTIEIEFSAPPAAVRAALSAAGAPVPGTATAGAVTGGTDGRDQR